MAKIASELAEVYDLIYPSPTTLKEISSIVVAFELQREGVGGKIDLKKVLPRLPSVIYDLLEERSAYCEILINWWQSAHHDETLTKNFDDFAYDWNGQIHYVRTARRMMRCERLSEEEKFKIACQYCFEDDIARIWPSVSRKMELNQVEFDEFPLLFYWICRLKDEMEKIPNPYNRLIDHIMLMRCHRYAWSSLEYFWNRIPVEKQLQTAKQSMHEASYDFFPFLARFIMNKLNDHHLDEWIAETGSEFVKIICYVLGSTYTATDKVYILPTWLFIRNKINESDFTSLIEKLLDEITNNEIVDNVVKERLRPTDPAYIASEIWKTTSLSFRRSAMIRVLNNREFYGKFIDPRKPREMRFLITVLLDASVEERSEFFLEYWTDLIKDARFKDFDLLIELCLKNENEIVEFKRNTMGKFENINKYICRLLHNGYLAPLAELNDFLTYCHPDTKTKREVMQRLLRQEFLGEESRYLDILSIIRRAKVFDEFIDSSFDNIDSATDFKNQILSSPVTEKSLFKAIEHGEFTEIMEFANVFVSAQAQVHLKERLFNYLKDLMIIGGTVFLKPNEFQIFLVWCLGSEDEVDKLKRSISPDDIFRNMVRYLKYGEHRETLTDDLDFAKKKYRGNMLNSFWRWYFTSPEEIKNLKERFAGELKFDESDESE